MDMLLLTNSVIIFYENIMGIEPSKEIQQITHTINRQVSEPRCYAKNNLLKAIRRKNCNPITTEYSFDSEEPIAGAHGVVKRGIHKRTGQIRAIKFIYKQTLTSKESKYIFNEVEILNSLDHPHTIEFIEYFDNEEFVAIVTNLIEGGELFDKIIQKGKFTEIEASSIIRQLLVGVNYLHQKSIVHRDLKPENILFDNNMVKIIDFGAATRLKKGKRLSKLTGTFYYIAPEVLERCYNEKCDIWSIGVILYILLSGVTPFSGKTQSRVMEKIIRGEYRLDTPELKDVSTEAKKFIASLMQMNVKSRLSAEEALNSPWLLSLSSPKPIIHDSCVFFNLQNTNLRRKVLRFIYLYMIVHVLPPKKTLKLQLIFLECDEDCDGLISKDELLNSLKKINLSFTNKEITNIINNLTENESGGLSYSEFLLGCIDKDDFDGDYMIRKFFNIIDQDSDGRIAFSDLKVIFGHLENNEPEIWRYFTNKFDHSYKRQFWFHEFKQIIFGA